MILSSSVVLRAFLKSKSSSRSTSTAKSSQRASTLMSESHWQSYICRTLKCLPPQGCCIRCCCSGRYPFWRRIARRSREWNPSTFYRKQADASGGSYRCLPSDSRYRVSTSGTLLCTDIRLTQILPVRTTGGVFTVRSAAMCLDATELSYHSRNSSRATPLYQPRRVKSSRPPLTTSRLFSSRSMKGSDRCADYEALRTS